MLEYEWGNPIMSADETAHQPDPNRPLFDHYHDHHSFTSEALYPPPTFSNPTHFHDAHIPTHFPQLYDPRTYSAAGYSSSHHSLMSLDQVSVAGGTPTGYFVVPKTEEVSRPLDFMSARIGLNLGGRTYFSSAEDDFVNRLYRRSRPGDPGSMNAPRCQAESCHADLSHSKHYHRRHKVCEFHSKASTVITNGLTQRFCQQCSRFHLLSEFDNGKRSCRKRLADHNRRRRKSQQPGSTNNPDTTKSPGPDSSSDNLVSRSPSDSGAHDSSSSVTVPTSPPRMSLDCFR